MKVLKPKHWMKNQQQKNRLLKQWNWRNHRRKERKSIWRVEETKCKNKKQQNHKVHRNRFTKIYPIWFSTHLKLIVFYTKYYFFFLRFATNSIGPRTFQKHFSHKMFWFIFPYLCWPIACRSPSLHLPCLFP